MIENLDLLKSQLEAAYSDYSDSSNPETLTYWKGYITQNPDQLDFCVNVLLNKEKEKQLSPMKGSISQTFLRDTDKNLTAEILLHVISDIDDSEYFKAREKNAKKIHEKLKELGPLKASISDDEFADPEAIQDEKLRKNVEELKTFLATLPNPIFQSKLSSILLEHPSKNDIHRKLTELNLFEADLGVSNDEWADPETIQDETLRKNVEELKTFLATLPNPIFQSKRLSILLQHLSKIDLNKINWVDQIFVLISISNKQFYKAQEELLQKNEQSVTRYLKPNESSISVIRDDINETFKKFLPALAQSSQDPAIEKDSLLDILFLNEYKRLCAKNEGLAKKRFFRFFLWQCKNAGLDSVKTGELYRYFLQANGLYPAFTDYLDIAALFPIIKTGIRSTQQSAQTEDSATVTDQKTIAFGEDMNDDEQKSLLQNFFRETSASTLACCITIPGRTVVNLKGNAQAFYVIRNKTNRANIISFHAFPNLQSLDIRAGKESEAFVLLISGNVSEKELKEKLQAFPELAHTLSTTLVREISTNNGKEPIAISMLPILPNNKKLHYIAHIQSQNPKAAEQFQQQLEACREFDHYKKLKKEVERITQETEEYLKTLTEEIEQATTAFKEKFQHTYVEPFQDPNTLQITSAEIGESASPETQNEFNPLREKIALRYAVLQLSKKLKQNNKTALEKLKDFSETLFGKTQENVEVARVAHSAPASAAQPNVEVAIGASLVAAPKLPSLAKRIENTTMGYHYLKAVLRTLAAFSIVLTIPTIVYCVATHKWPWQTEGKALTNLTDSLKTKFVR